MKKSKIISLVLTGMLLVFSALTACSPDTTLDTTPDTSISQKAVPTYPVKEYQSEEEAWEARRSLMLHPVFIETFNTFSYKTASELLRDETTNAFYSPGSLYFALSAAAAGAAGQSREELLALLGFETEEELAEECHHSFISLYQNQDIYKLQIASSLWADMNISLKQPFLDHAKDDYFMEIYQADLASGHTSDAMAQWVKDHTAGLLEPSVELSDDAMLSLLNTVYYYDEWLDQFNPEATKDDIFTCSNGTKLTASFMNRTVGSGSYRRGANYISSALSTKNGQVLFVLPNEGTNVHELLASPDTLMAIAEGTDGESGFGEVVWSIPKFSYDSEYDLKDTLCQLGLEDVFSDQSADFTSMTDEKVWMDDIKQQSHVAIDENGIEAASFTAIDWCGAAPPQGRAEMILNRPFLYIIQVDGCSLFIGICEIPLFDDSAIDQTGQESIFPFTDAANTDASNTDTANEQLLEGFDWDFTEGRVTLSQVQKDLDDNKIPYEAHFNVSGERLDMTLENGTPLIFLGVMKPEESRNRFSYWSSSFDSDSYELIMMADKFNGNSFQENYLNEYDVTFDQYYYPDLSQEVDESVLWSCNQTDLSIARNQLYAKYGYSFKDPFLNHIFSRKSWYQPKENGNVSDQFTNREWDNLNFVRNLEKVQDYVETLPEGYQSAPGILSGSWFDLDGDGTKEQLFYEKHFLDQDFADVTLTVKYGGENSSEASLTLSEMINPYARCYIASMDGKSYEIIVASSGFSDDFALDFFSFHDGSLNKLGTIYSHIHSLAVGQQDMTAAVETYHLQCQPVTERFLLKDGQIQQIKEDYYTYANNVAVARNTIPLYKDRTSSNPGITLKSGDEVRILGGDLEQWVELELVRTGETGWLEVKGSDCILSDGTHYESYELFDGLQFYG